MRVKIDTLERERDFYFDKLREIEILCQNQAVSSTPVRVSGLNSALCKQQFFAISSHTLRYEVISIHVSSAIDEADIPRDSVRCLAMIT